MSDSEAQHTGNPDSQSERIPVILCIDVEPDDRISDLADRKDWDGFEASLEVFNRFRERFEARTGSVVHFSWFLKMDPQVAMTHGSASWVVDRYPEAIRQLQACGDHFGLHIHPFRWHDASEEWVADFGDQEWINHCVRSGIDAFQTSLLQSCRMFRFGDRWMNDATIDLLETLGVQIDLTVEMGQRPDDLPETITGFRPDYSNVPRQPYHPSSADFRRESADGDHGLWMVPISGGSVRSPKLPVDRRPGSEAWVVSRPGSSSSGMILAHPNPIPISRRGEAGTTTIQWSAAGTDQIEVHVHAPDGPVFSRGGPSGVKTAGEWVTNGTLFFLQDVSGRLPLTEANTLATLRVYTTIGEEQESTDDREKGEEMTLNLAFNSLLFARVMDNLLHTLSYPYLAIVMRSDTANREDQRFNLEQSLDAILNHPLAGRFVFQSPEEMIRGFESRRGEGRSGVPNALRLDEAAAGSRT